MGTRGSGGVDYLWFMLRGSCGGRGGNGDDSMQISNGV